jgi:hypothetical protein
MQKMFIKKYFLFMVGSDCHVKRFKTGSRQSEGHSKVADDETEVEKWLRQQSTDFYAV